MKLRYYLRRLGIGIIVTAVIISFTRQPEKLTDAQIKMRALELGMVEESVLADLQNKKEESKIPAFEDIVNMETEEQKNTAESNSEAQNGLYEGDVENDVETQDGLKENSFTDNTEERTDHLEESENEEIDDSVNNAELNNGITEILSNEMVENYIVILVESGNGSEIVSRRLFEAGLVNSAVEYNRFLVENGYAKKIRVGNHEIPAEATEDEIARILCGM